MKFRTDWSSILLAGAFAAASLWDFRAYGVRIFDIVAFGLLLGSLVLMPRPFEDWLARRRPLLLLFGTIIVYAIVGYVVHRHRSSIAVLVFCILALQLFGRDDWQLIGRALVSLVFFHITFFLIQFLAYYCFGILIDYYQWIGQAPARIIRSDWEIRAAGLFQEPNSYCLNLFILSVGAVLCRPSRLLAFVAAITFLLSQSIWGIGAAVVLLAINELRTSGLSWRFIARCVAVVFGSAVIFNAYVWVTKPHSDKIPFYYIRLTEIAKDPSVLGRYMGAQCRNSASCHCTNRQADSDSKFVAAIFGSGLTTKYFLECLPANGFAFLFKSFGIIGFIVLIAGLAFALTGFSLLDKLAIALSLALIFTSYPLMTYLIFWLWLVYILHSNKKQRPVAEL